MFQYALKDYQKEVKQLDEKAVTVQLEELEAQQQLAHLERYWQYCDEMAQAQKGILYGSGYCVSFACLGCIAPSLVYQIGCGILSVVAGAWSIKNIKVCLQRRNEVYHYAEYTQLSNEEQEEFFEEQQKEIRRTQQELALIQEEKKEKEQEFQEDCFFGMQHHEPYYLADTEEEYQSLVKQQAYCQIALEDYFASLPLYQRVENCSVLSDSPVLKNKQKTLTSLKK